MRADANAWPAASAATALAAELAHAPGARRLLASAAIPLAVAALTLLLLAEPALAQATSSGGYQTVLSAVRGFLKFLTGPFGKAIASIGLIICGIGWVAGKMNIAWLLYVVVGAAIIFGAEQIIDSIASGGGQL